MKLEHPLAPWLVAFLIVAVILSWSHTTGVDEDLLWEQRLDQRLDAVTAVTDVVAIGTSLTQGAVGPAPLLEDALTVLGRSPVVTRLFRPGRVWQWQPMLERLATHPPKLLLVELMLLVEKPTEPRGSLGAVPNKIRRMSRGLNAFAEAWPHLPSRRLSRERWKAAAERFESRTSLPIAVPDMAAPQLDSFYPLTERGWTALEALKNAGCAIVVLDLPRHPESPLPIELRRRLDQTNSELRQAGFYVLSVPAAPAECFDDQVHLSPVGSQRVRPLLAETLRHVLAERP